jgi:predicted Zn finger-like uncharacterized protein
MLANKMMGDSGETKDSAQDLSSEPHVVVACPSCRTKFAVESSLVAAYETPKFHCSRCDSVFDLTPKTKHVTSNQHAHNHDSKRWVLVDNNDTNTPNPFAQPQTSAHSSPAVTASDFTLGSSSDQPVIEPRKPFAPLEERAGVSLLGLRPSAGATIASTTITRQQALSHTAEPTPTISHDEDDPFALFDPPSAIAGHQTAQSSSPTAATPPAAPPRVERVAITAPTLPSEPAQQPSISYPSAPKSYSKPNTSTDTVVADTETPRPSRSSRIRELAANSLARLSERNQGLVRMSTPVLCALLIVCVLGYSARIMPRTFDALFSTIIPSVITGKIAHTPDPLLHVQGVSIEFEKTQSKEVVPVVRGVINNATGHSIEEVLVEALGFNIRGEVVVRAKAPLRSALVREKISDLPLDTVRKFQGSLSARNSTINSGENVAFTVALLSENGRADDVTYFSARVFSAGKAR